MAEWRVEWHSGVEEGHVKYCVVKVEGWSGSSVCRVVEYGVAKAVINKPRAAAGPRREAAWASII